MNSTFYQKVSYWLESCGDELTPRPKLEQSMDADIAILGAGFSGLWTAYYLSLKYPGLRIIILEKEITGFGASGRNGGWCSSKFALSPDMLLKRYGRDTARALQSTMYDAVDEVGRVIEKECMDVDWKKGGSLSIALGDTLPLLEKRLKTYQKLGLDNHYQFLNKDHTEKRIRVGGAKGSLLSKESAVLHPGKLVRQLARVLEKRGVKIYEQTEVIDIQEGGSGKSSALITKYGTVSAKWVTVLAGEAYLSKLKKYHRSLIPVYSQIVLTEPLSEKQWAAIGWEGRETVASTRLTGDYLQRTADGRIAFGGRGRPYRYGSKISSLNTYEPRIESLKKMGMKWFPLLFGIRFTHEWGGPFGVTRDWTPNFWLDKKRRMAGVWGFVGQGVSTTNLAGRILCDLISEEKSGLADFPMVQHTSEKWEPEPFRWTGVHYVEKSLQRLDDKWESAGLVPNGRTLAERLSSH